MRRPKGFKKTLWLCVEKINNDYQTFNIHITAIHRKSVC